MKQTIFLLIYLVAGLFSTLRAQEILLYDHEAVRMNTRTVLGDLGLSFSSSTIDSFNTQLSAQPWDLVIIDAPGEIPVDINSGAVPEYGSTEWDDLRTYISGGGKVIMSFWEASDSPTFGYTEMTVPEDFGLIQTGSALYNNVSDGHQAVHIWDSGHAFFDGITGPLTPADDFNPAPVNFILGTKLNATTGIPVAGFNPDPAQTFQSAIIVGNGGNTVYNGFLFDELVSDDGRRLIANEIQALLIPEPGALGLVLFGFALIAQRLRRKR